MADLFITPGYDVIESWLKGKGFSPFLFQEEAWQYIIAGESGLVNAPTGCGKTFSVFLGSVIQFINDHPKDWKTRKNNGLQLLWLTPLRALAKDIGRAMEEVFEELGMQWSVGIRNGDTALTERAKQKRQMPEVLIITPESLQLLLAMKENPVFFRHLRIIAVDEWHELIGSKRGVQVELAISHIVHLKNIAQRVAVWGISATIGNLDEAQQILLSPLKKEGVLVKANLNKKIQIESVFPDEIEKFPWAGHLGIKLAHKLKPIIDASRTTLIFINTRGMSETWYQTLLTVQPELAGVMALHHGSVEQEIRTWIEEALHEGTLKVVIATASLDLGVDFRPVDTVVQVGSPKGVARFLQRAGRSGHQPDAISKIYFLPTHSLELSEAAALKEAVFEQEIESRDPMMLCFDVLIQFLCTLAVGDGFNPKEIFEEVKATYCFADVTEAEWDEMLHFIVNGGNALQQYDEYQKVIIDEEDGLYKITNRRTAMRHRMHIGTIVSEPMMKIKFMGGGFVGVLEENFIAKLQPGDVFMLAGRKLELVNVKDMVATVKKSNAKKAIVPNWAGGRMPLSSNLSALLRRQLSDVALWLDGKPVIDRRMNTLANQEQIVSRMENRPVTIASGEVPLSRGEGLGVRSADGDASITVAVDNLQINATQSHDSTAPSIPSYHLTDPSTWHSLLPFAKEMRHEPTLAENVLWERVRNKQVNNCKFRRQYPIENFIADFICVEKRLIVELDGEGHNQPDQKEYDRQRAMVLAQKGFRIIRFYNEEVLKKMPVVMEKIKKKLEVEETAEMIIERLRKFEKAKQALHNIPSSQSQLHLTPNPSPRERSTSPEAMVAERNFKKQVLKTPSSHLPPELTILKPLFDLQRQLSHIPLETELLIEHIQTDDGYHLFVYPFEGRLVHEAMSALMALRISEKYPITFSIAMNDYGFELLSDQPIPVDDTNAYEWLSPENLLNDIQKSNNATEMAKRKFRDVAVIGGLVFQGMPGERKKARHLQASSSLLFKVFAEYDPNNLLLRQAYNEVLQQQMEEVRLRTALQRIQASNIIIRFPSQLTPFCFPIKVDSLRETLTSEKMEDRIKKMLAAN